MFDGFQEMQSQFSRLAPFIREYIYEKKWIALRSIQEAAVMEILDGNGHILIASGTASGKTEACFFPVISLFCENRPRSVGALYIGPLKALINDQAERLIPLTEQAGLPLWRWHGDVSAHHKNNLLKNPSGILQITPESLEALLLRSPASIRSMFSDLSFVIIDEVHAFMGSERGNQILCQLARIEESALCRPRRIGLSATLGDYRMAMEWLRQGSSRAIHNDVALIKGADRRRIRIALDHFVRNRAEERIYYESLYQQVRGHRSIIFTNSRIEAEDTIAALRELAAKFRDKDRFFVHHGSVSASLRNETERELRDSAGPVTAAATATLEMGIDIGSLDRVIQIGPPLSVSAFVQRLGRSGRLKKKPEIYFTSIEEPPTSAQSAVSGAEEKHPVNSLPWDLVKTIATIELYLKEKWIEADNENPLPYSLMVHQCLSILCSLGAHSPESIRQRVLSLPAFSRADGHGCQFSETDFDELISHLITLDLIEKTADSEIIAGLGAGRLTSHYSFYSVFAGAAEYRVTAGGREIGYVNFIPPEGSNIVLGGRYWRVENVAQREKEIMVSHSESGGGLLWRGSGVDLHRRTAAGMRKVLAENSAYPYLTQRAGLRLAEARELAKLWRLGEEIFIPAAEKEQFVLIPWLGSRSMRALLLVLQNREYRKCLGIRSLSRENEFSINICSSLSIPIFSTELAGILSGHTTHDSLYSLIDPAKIPLTGKLDSYLPARALIKQYAEAMLDVEWGELCD